MIITCVKKCSLFVALLILFNQREPEKELITFTGMIYNEVFVSSRIISGVGGSSWLPLQACSLPWRRVSLSV